MSDRKLPDDRELDDFLAGRGDLSRRYRDGFSREGAPPELDRAILDLAAQAVEREQRARKRAFIVPLSIAASVVVVFSLVVVMRQQTGGLPPTAMDGGSAARGRTPEPPPPVSDAPAPQPAQEAPARADAPVLEDSSAAKMQMQQLEPAPLEAAPSARMSAPAPAPAAPAAGFAAPPANVAAPEQDAAREQKAEVEAVQRQERRRDALGAAASRGKTRAAEDSLRSAASALELIRALKEQGEIVAAREQLDAFQQAYPDAEIPEDLRSLLRPVNPATP